jgi:hypothetical protein
MSSSAMFRAAIPLFALLLFSSGGLHPGSASATVPVVTQTGPTGGSLRDALIAAPFTDGELPYGLSSPGAAAVTSAGLPGSPSDDDRQTVAVLLAGSGLVGQITYTIFPDPNSALAQLQQDAALLSLDDSVGSQAGLPPGSSCGIAAAPSTAPAGSVCLAVIDAVEIVVTLSSMTGAGSVPLDVAANLERAALDHVALVSLMLPEAGTLPSPITASAGKVANALFSTPVSADELPTGFSAVLINAGSTEGPVGMSYNLTFGVASENGQPSGQFTYSVYAGTLDAKSGFDFSAGRALQAGDTPSGPASFQFPAACFDSGPTSGIPSCSVLVGPVVVTAQTGDADGARSLAAVAVSHLAHAIAVASG